MRFGPIDLDEEPIGSVGPAGQTRISRQGGVLVQSINASAPTALGGGGSSWTISAGDGIEIDDTDPENLISSAPATFGADTTVSLANSIAVDLEGDRCLSKLVRGMAFRLCQIGVPAPDKRTPDARQRLDMRFELGPAGKAVISGECMLRVGQLLRWIYLTPLVEQLLRLFLKVFETRTRG